MEGLKIKDSEGNIWTTLNITTDHDTKYPNGVSLSGESGKKEISSFDLLYYEVVK